MKYVWTVTDYDGGETCPIFDSKDVAIEWIKKDVNTYNPFEKFEFELTTDDDVFEFVAESPIHRFEFTIEKKPVYENIDEMNL